MIDENRVHFTLCYALRCAITSDNLNQVSKILRENPHFRPDQHFIGSCSPFHYACSIGAISSMAYFIQEFKCDPNSRNSPFGMAPIHNAALNGHLRVLDCLWESSANFMLEDEYGENLVHKACIQGDLNFISELIHKFDLHELLLRRDLKGQRPVEFLKDMIDKELHPKQLTNQLANQQEELNELYQYVHKETKDYQKWHSRKWIVLLRAKLGYRSLI